MASALQLVTNLLKGHKLEAVVSGLTEDGKKKLAEALESFFAVDNARALVTVGELAKSKEVHTLAKSQCKFVRVANFFLHVHGIVILCGVALGPVREEVFTTTAQRRLTFGPPWRNFVIRCDYFCKLLKKLKTISAHFQSMVAPGTQGK